MNSKHSGIEIILGNLEAQHMKRETLTEKRYKLYLVPKNKTRLCKVLFIYETDIKLQKKVYICKARITTKLVFVARFNVVVLKVFTHHIQHGKI